MTLEDNSIEELVRDLDEVYQPIYKYPHLSNKASRTCEDRLIAIQDVFRCLDCANKPLRVLDLGCAQGYFSFSLAEMGADVIGIDNLEKNIAVCKALQTKNKLSSIDFIHGNIEDLLDDILREKIDLVLGLSVFHHIIYDKGIEYVVNMLTSIYARSKVSLLEFAGTDEGVYWCEYQPENHENLFKNAKFSRQIAEFSTHLSKKKRPFYYASNECVYLDKKLWPFEAYKNKSHQLNDNVHKGSRPYYFSRDYSIKYCKLRPLIPFNHKYRISVSTETSRANIREYKRELNFLKKVEGSKKFPSISNNGMNEVETWIIRKKIDGKNLLDLILNGDHFNSEKVIENVLSQLVYLESLGLYHDDIRLWNLLIDKGGNCHLIDYGSISNEKTDCVRPHENLWAFLVFVSEVTSRESLRMKENIPLLNHYIRLPSTLQIWFSKAFSLQKGQISYKKLKDIYDEKIDQTLKGDDFSADHDCYMNIIEEASQGQLKRYNKEHKVETEVKKSNEKKLAGILKRGGRHVLAMIYAASIRHKFIEKTLRWIGKFCPQSFKKIARSGRQQFIDIKRKKYAIQTLAATHQKIIYTKSSIVPSSS